MTAVALLSACSADEETGKGGEGNAAVEVGPKFFITNNLEMGESSFEVGDQLALYGWAGSDDFAAGELWVNNNTLTLTSGTEANYWNPSSPLYWKKKGVAHHFMAVSPARDIADVHFQEFSLVNPLDDSNDLMMGRTFTPIIYNGETTVPTVDMEMHHLMAYLRVEVTLRNEYEQSMEADKVKVIAYTNGIVDYTKEIDGTPDYQQMVRIANSVMTKEWRLAKTETNKFASYMIPQEGVPGVTVNVRGREYIYNYRDASGLVANLPLEAGRITTLKLTLGRDVLTLGSITVKDWEEDAVVEDAISYYLTTENGKTWFNVKDAKGLYAWAKDANTDPTVCLRLFGDVELPMQTLEGEAITIDGEGVPSGSNWKAVKLFKGAIDGQGHQIKNMVINVPTETDYGFVGVADEGTEIRNLTFSEAVLYVRDNYLYPIQLGVICGQMYKGTIENCSATGRIDCRYSGLQGLVGNATNSTIIACANGTNIVGGFYVGGFAGLCSEVEMVGCYNYGDLSLHSFTYYSEYIGGLVGYDAVGSSFYGCYNNGTISTDNADASGALLGWAYNSALHSCVYKNGSNSNAIGQSVEEATGDFAGYDDLTLAKDDMNTAIANYMSSKGYTYAYRYVVNTDPATMAKQPLVLQRVNQLSMTSETEDMGEKNVTTSSTETLGETNIQNP